MSVVRRKLAMWKAQVWLIRCAQSCNEFLFWVGECVNEGRERKRCKWLLLWTRDGGWENQQTLNLALRVSLDIRTRKKPLSALFWRNQNGNSSSPVCVCQTTNKGKRDRVWDAGLYIWLEPPELLSGQLAQVCFRNAKSSPPFSFTQEWREIGMLQTKRLARISNRSCCCAANPNWGLYHTVCCRGIMHIYEVIWCVRADPCQCGLVPRCCYEKHWYIQIHVMINRKRDTDWLNRFGWRPQTQWKTYQVKFCTHFCTISWGVTKLPSQSYASTGLQVGIVVMEG